jgi:hypothetical protein
MAARLDPDSVETESDDQSEIWRWTSVKKIRCWIPRPDTDVIRFEKLNACAPVVCLTADLLLTSTAVTAPSVHQTGGAVCMRVT